MRQLKRSVAVLIAAVLILVIVSGSFLYVNSLQNSSVQLEDLDVAYSPFESLALFWVAQQQGFFTENALNVTVHRYDSGAAALSGVINGEADIAVGTAEFPLVIRALNNVSVQTIGTISKSNFAYLVARIDSGISDITDLRGKTIGTTFGTIAHYYLGRFLVLNGVQLEDVNLVDLKTPDEWVNAVVNGSIDAVATAQPYANLAKDGLGNNAVVWSINSNQPQYTQAIATNEWIVQHPDLSISFLKSLYQAEKFINQHADDAKEILQRQMNFTDAYMETVWQQNQFSLSLDQSLILTMEAEARWLISNHLTNQTAMRDFNNYVSVNALLVVKPESVTIIK